MRRSCFVLLLMLLIAGIQSFAACHAVGPSATGNGSGSDWNNRMNKLPSTLIRGDSYYLMDGSYGNYSVTTANSNTTRITIKKAQSYDYGRTADGCSSDISAGWNAATMGSNQAVFGALTANSPIGYITLDGNGRTTVVSCGLSPAVGTAALDCGLKFSTPFPTQGGGNVAAIWVNPNYDNGVSRAIGWTIRYVELQGAGDAGNQVSGNSEETFMCRNGCNNLLIEHSYFHDTSCDFFKIPYGDTVVIDHNHFKQNASSSNCHGQMAVSDGSPQNNFSWSNNLIQDIQGTAYWSIVNGGDASNWQVFNNVIFQTQGSSRPGVSGGGFFACVNPGTNCTNIKIIGNTFINDRSDYDNSFTIHAPDTSGNTFTLQNNLFYQITSAQTTNPIGTPDVNGTVTADHNTFLNVGSPNGLSGGTGDVTVASGSPNPFVNWPGYNFQLTGNSTNWNSGLTQSSPFNVDFLGSARPGTDGIWSRGAFEVAGAQAQGPTPPLNLTASVQ